MYATAIDHKWTGNTTACNAATDLMDPDYLFDTSCNLASHGGSLGVGTRYTEKNFTNMWGANPSATEEPQFETLFSNAYQKYDPAESGYGDAVIRNAHSFEPNPAGATFTTGGQQ